MPHVPVLAALVLLAACRPEDHDSTLVPGDSGAETGLDTGDSGLVLPEGLDVALDETIPTLVTVSWEQDVAGTAWVEYRFDDEDWMHTPYRAVEAGPASALLLGIPYETTFEFRVASDDSPDETPDEANTVRTGTGRAVTGDWPESLPEPTLLVHEPDAEEPTGRYLLGSINAFTGGWTGGRYWKFILDRKGRVVWALETPDNHWSIYLRVARDGTEILYDEATWWSDMDQGAGSKVHRIKIDGSEVEVVDTPGLHHAFTELDDGTLVWGAASWTDENLVQRPPGGEVETIWNCGAWQDQHGATRDCQSNSLWWNEKDDTFLYSFYSSGTVAEIDHQTGETLRWWGNLEGSWDFDPADSLFWWQHGVTFTDEGTLLLSTYREHEAEDNELVVREYSLDEDNRVLHQVWTFGEGEGIFGSTAGEAHRLPGGNTLHNYGSDSRVREITPEGEVVWDVDWEGSRLLGRTVFLDDLYDFAP